MTIKALTLHQPWASLWMWGAKVYETRSWSTSYRGPLAVHAAKTLPSYAVEETEENDTIRGILAAHGVALQDLPRGVVLGVGNLAEIAPAETVQRAVFEDDLGNFAPGRFAWRLEERNRFDEPIPARGYQCLWNWEMP